MLAREFTGSHLTIDGTLLDAGSVQFQLRTAVVESPETFGHLFMLPNGSTGFTVQQPTQTPDMAPPGLYIQSTHSWIQPGHRNSVGLYSLASGRAGVFMDGITSVRTLNRRAALND